MQRATRLEPLGLGVMWFLLCALIYMLTAGFWMGFVVSPFDLVTFEQPVALRLAITLLPPLAPLLLLACSWRREAAKRRALLNDAVRTTSGFAFVRRPGSTPADAVLILEGEPLDAAVREYVAQVHVARGDRESLKLGRLHRAGALLSLELETALGGREVVHFRDAS